MANAIVTADHVRQDLNRLAELRREELEAERELNEAIDTALTPRMKEKVEAIRSHHLRVRLARSESISHLEANIKAATLTVGATVAADTLQAIYSGGKMTWNSDSLKGFAVEHPEILQFHKKGDPYVSISERSKCDKNKDEKNAA